MREAPHFLSPLRAPVKFFDLKIFEQEETEGVEKTQDFETQDTRPEKQEERRDSSANGRYSADP